MSRFGGSGLTRPEGVVPYRPKGPRLKTLPAFIVITMPPAAYKVAAVLDAYGVGDGPVVQIFRDALADATGLEPADVEAGLGLLRDAAQVVELPSDDGRGLASFRLAWREY